MCFQLFSGCGITPGVSGGAIQQATFLPWREFTLHDFILLCFSWQQQLSVWCLAMGEISLPNILFERRGKHFKKQNASKCRSIPLPFPFLPFSQKQLKIFLLHFPSHGKINSPCSHISLFLSAGAKCGLHGFLQYLHKDFPLNFSLGGGGRVFHQTPRLALQSRMRQTHGDIVS